MASFAAMSGTLFQLGVVVSKVKFAHAASINCKSASAAASETFQYKVRIGTSCNP